MKCGSGRAETVRSHTALPAEQDTPALLGTAGTPADLR
jgi:hypothetical protein